MSEDILAVDTEPVKTAQTVAPDTEPSGYMSPTGELREGAPEKIANLFGSKKWNNVDQLVDGYSELEKLVGAGEHIFKPESTDDVDGWNKYYTQLGRPETHDKYEFEYDGDIELGDELVGQFKEYAHSLGLTQNQFNKIVNFQIDAVAGQSEAYNAQAEAQKQANIEALQLKWGTNFQAKITGARIIADSLGIYKTLEGKGLASDPVIIEMLDTIASRTAEDVITPTPPTTPDKTPLEEMAELKKSEPFLKKFDPKHKEAMARFMELNQIIAQTGVGPKRNSR